MKTYQELKISRNEPDKNVGKEQREHSMNREQGTYARGWREERADCQKPQVSQNF